MIPTDSKLENSSNQRMNKGFTLVEFLVAICLVSLLASAIISLFTVLNRSYTAQNVSADVQQAARIGIDLMAQNIRLAGLNPSGSAEAGFGAVSSTRIEFRADRDMNGVIDTDPEKWEHITYYLDNKQLKRKLAESTRVDPLINDVAALVFTYFDAGGGQTTDPADIHSVKISMTVQEPAGRAEPVRRTYSTRIRCRNIGL